MAQGGGPLRVLFLNEALGGHTTVHHNLRVELQAHPDVDATFVDVPSAGVARRILGGAVPGLADLDLDLQPVRAQLAAAAVARRLLQSAGDRFDVWHIYTANAALLSSDLLSRHPSVVTTDTTNVHNATRLPYRSPTKYSRVNAAIVKPLERRVLKAADTVVANSVWAADSMRSDYGLADSQIRLIRFGISAPRDRGFDQQAPGLDPTDALPKVTFVGRQLERKGALRLLRLHQEHFVDRFELVLVTTEAVAPARNVTVIDSVRPGDGTIWDILRASAIFAFPSPIDQAPNAVLEAMAAGLPVIAVDEAAQAEMVVEGETGLLVQPEDDASLGAALDSLLANADTRVAMGAAGRARALEHYDMATSTRDLVAELRRVATESPKRGTGGGST